MSAGKSDDHRGVGGGLGEVEAVVPAGAKQRRGGGCGEGAGGFSRGLARGLYGMRTRPSTVQEVGDGGGVHVAHVSELGGLLGVEEVAVGVEDGEGGNALLERDVVLVGDVEVVVDVADVDVDEDEVVVEEFERSGLGGSRCRGPGSRRTSRRRSRG